MDHDTNLRRRYAMSNLKSKTSLDKNAPPLLRSDSKAVIHAPVDKIDIPEWLFTLTDEEYQQCAIAHLSIALGLDTLTSAAASRRAGIEARLMLGGTRFEALQP